MVEGEALTESQHDLIGSSQQLGCFKHRDNQVQGVLCKMLA